MWRHNPKDRAVYWKPPRPWPKLTQSAQWLLSPLPIHLLRHWPNGFSYPVGYLLLLPALATSPANPLQGSIVNSLGGERTKNSRTMAPKLPLNQPLKRTNWQRLKIPHRISFPPPLEVASETHISVFQDCRMMHDCQSHQFRPHRSGKVRIAIEVVLPSRQFRLMAPVHSMMPILRGRCGSLLRSEIRSYAILPWALERLCQADRDLDQRRKGLSTKTIQAWNRGSAALDGACPFGTWTV